MKKLTLLPPLAVALTAIGAALAVFTTSAQAQVTENDLTNGLVIYYPLDGINPDGLSTPDYVSGRDMLLWRMGADDVVASDRTVGTANNCFNFTQSGGPTVIYYHSQGQDPLTGEGDFLPFCNQINGTMNFWIKGNSTGGDTRFFGECDIAGNNNPLYLWGDHSSYPGGAHLLFRQEQGTGPGGSIPMVDGTFQLPVPGYYVGQGDGWTTNLVLTGTGPSDWHMFTVTFTNGFTEVYVDGVRDPGSGTYIGPDGTNTVVSQPQLVTNFWYTTNLYPYVDPPASNPPPHGFVRWMFNSIFKTGSTCFGGFKRGATPSAGLAVQIDDIGFWDRALSPGEIVFMMTNGLPNLTQNTNIIRINQFTADFGEVGQGGSVRFSWNVAGVSTSPGSLVISGVGDVSALGATAETNISLPEIGEYTFTLTAHNGVDTDKEASVTVKTFGGVDSNWDLVQRFDGLYNDTSFGIQDDIYGESRWSSSLGSFAGDFDRFNVVTMTTGGGANKVLSPRSGYVPDAGSVTGFDSQGALCWGLLGGLTMEAGDTNTLFFRFSISDPESFVDLSAWSGLDLTCGLSEYNFWEGPLAAGGFGVGCSLKIQRIDASFAAVPFDLTANDYDGTNTAGAYSYINDGGNADGLETNVNYYVWMDVEQYDSMPNGTNGTLNPPKFSAWLQKQGDPNRTLLFSGFSGDRDFGAFDPIGSNANEPSATQDKVFFNMCNQSVLAVEGGAFFETNNMIVIDDIYLSKDGVESSVPRILELSSIVLNSGDATITWTSLGNLFGLETYSVHRTTDITAGFTTIATGVPSDGDSTSYTDTTLGGSDTAYYQISWP